MQAIASLHDVQMVVPVPWPERVLHRHLTHSRETHEVDRFRVHYPTYWYSPKILRQHYGRFYLASIRKIVRRILKDFSPEAVLAFWSHPDGWAAVQIARELGVPVIIKVMGSDVLVLGRNPRRRQLLAETLRAADGVFAVSRDLAEHVIELGVDSQKVRVVPEGIDMELFAPGDRSTARAARAVPANAKMLLFAGNLLLTKGAGVLIEACAILASRGVQFSCYLVGQGKDESKLRAMAQERHITGKVIFAGACDQRTLVGWYRAADVVTLPSFSEGIPNVLREAMQCHRPFVATRVGGIPEISDSSICRLVAPGNAAELADALQAMLASPPEVTEAIPSRFNMPWSRSAEMVTSLLRMAISANSEMPSEDTAELAIR
jgi:glycosyltransferase involved in cell wall biosynthesis